MNEHLIFQWLRGPFSFFCVSVNIFCSDHSADHQKLNIIQKWTFYFLITQGAFFIFLHFSQHFLLGLLGRSSKVEHNPKTNILFWWLMGPFSIFCILVNILCSDCLADHQKLNIIQKWTFDFSMAYRAFFVFLCFSQHFLLGLLSQSSEVEHNWKTNILFFNDLGGLFSFFCILVNVLCSDHAADHQKLNVIKKWTFYFSMT